MNSIQLSGLGASLSCVGCGAALGLIAMVATGNPAPRPVAAIGGAAFAAGSVLLIAGDLKQRQEHIQLMAEIFPNGWSQ